MNEKNRALTWYPVMLPAMLMKYYPGNEKYPREFAFWEPDAAWYYPHVLVSLGLFGKNEEFVKPKHATVMADSGGYQYGSKKGTDLSPEWVIKKAEEVSDISFILDMPTYKLGRDYSDDWFERCKRITKVNGDKMSSLRTREDFKLYGVIQGKNEDQWDRWYKAVSKEYDYDGWGFGFTNASEPAHFVKAIKWLDEMGLKKNIHFFGLLSRAYFGVLSYGLKRYGFEGCTTDSAVKPVYVVLPTSDFNVGRRIGRNLEEFPEPYCPCQLCEAYGKMLPPHETTRTNFVHAHNIFMWFTMFEWCNTLCDVKEDVEACFPEVKDTLELFDEDQKSYKQGKLKF